MPVELIVYIRNTYQQGTEEKDLKLFKRDLSHDIHLLQQVQPLTDEWEQTMNRIFKILEVLHDKIC